MSASYDERFRAAERISTAFVESTVDTVVGKRFAKRLIEIVRGRQRASDGEFGKAPRGSPSCRQPAETCPRPGRARRSSRRCG
jgi:hypothetical protein